MAEMKEVHVYGVYELVIEAWNGIDALMRISNMARRAKLSYQEVSASFEEDRRLRVRITATGDGFEARWLAAKLSRMPEIYRVETRLVKPLPPGGEG
ncbi:MAG: hypothetical protein GXO15_03400 [Crenarchaeota archaeon]|nr:hypothetical protein [Thermoproteota archaeon]